MPQKPSYEDMENRIAELERQIKKYQSDAIKYQTLFHVFPHGITVSDQFGNIVECNAAAEKLLGIGKAEHKGRMIDGPKWRIIRPDGSDMPPNEWACVKALKENPHVENCEMGIVKPNDTVCWINVTAAPLPIEGFGVVVTYSEITERKLMQASLKESQERLRLIADNIPDSFMYQYTQNEKGPQFLFVSSGVEKVFPWLKSRDVLNDATTLLGLIEPLQILSFQKAVETSARQLTDFSMDLQERCSIGEPRWFHVHSRPRQSQAGQIVWDGVIIDISDRKRAEAKVEMLAQQRQLALDAAKLGWWQYDPITHLATWDDRYQAIFGVSGNTLPIEEIQQKMIHPDDLHSLWTQVEAALDPVSPKPYAAQYRIIRPDGQLRWIEAYGITIFEGEGDNRHAVNFVGTVADITERKEAEAQRKNLEAQLLQAQKLESVGRLAGGVAHDLNNLLTPILGYSEMLRVETASDDSTQASLNEIIAAGIRARNLVRQLLAFSRKQVLEYIRTDLNSIVDGLKNLLRRTIPEDINFEIVHSSVELPVRVDSGQIEQVILNLAVNAADAMLDGGTITMETNAVHLDVAYAEAHNGVDPGAYALLTVSDMGHGMDEETIKKIFEPFFTTKGEQGTGLGLATAYGIVKQHNGHIVVYSEPGNGTTFKIYLPLTEKEPIADHPFAKTAAELTGTETILLVEDNEQVRALSLAILRRKGYTVITAEDGQAALAVLDRSEGPVHLLLTDVVMPGMNGRDLFVKAAEKRPGLKVLFMSGYMDNVIAHRGVLDPGVAFIQKPFTVKDLAAKVREVLDDEKDENQI